jgi:RNA polymerase sigma-B factor
MAARTLAPAVRTSRPARKRDRSGQRHAGRPERRLEEHRLLARYARTRDPIVLEQLVERFTPLARQLASRYRGQEPFEDLMQVASVGLINAINRFDPDRGLAFSSFAVPTILGELRRHFRDRTWLLHVDRGVKDRSAVVERTIDQLTRTQGGRPPSVVEIAELAELTPEEVVEAINARTARYVLSVDASGDDEEEASPLIERIGEKDVGYDAVEYGAAIAPIVDGLPARERTILHLRFIEDMTQSEIAARVGISQMQVSRILRATLARLREELPNADRE